MRARPRALWEDDSAVREVKRWIPYSLGLHGVLALLVVVGGFFRASLPLPPPSYEVVLMAPIKRGTPGGGASKTVPVPVATAAPVETELTIPNAEDVRRAALERAAREAALNRVAQGVKATPAPAATALAVATAAKPAGSEGTGDGGVEYGTWNGIPGSATYEQQIIAIVNENWKPIGQATEDVVIFRLKIAFDGEVASVDVEKESDNAAFDARARATLRGSSFPPPPLDLKLYLANKGIQIRIHNRPSGAGGLR